MKGNISAEISAATSKKAHKALKKINVAKQPIGVVIITSAIIIALAAIRFLASPATSLCAVTPPGFWLDKILPVEWDVVPTILLMAVNAFILTWIGVRNMLYTTSPFLTAVTYLTVCSTFFFGQGSLLPIVSSFFIVLGLMVIIPGFRRGTSFNRCFLGAAFMGCSALFYAPATVMVVGLPLIMAVILRSWREQVVAMTGLLLPFAVGTYIYWGMGVPAGYLAEKFAAALWQPAVWTTYDFTDPFFITAALLTVLVLLLSLVTFVAVAENMRTRPFRIAVLFIALLAVLAGGFLLPCRSPAMMQLLAVPMGVVAPFYFARRTGILPLTIYIAWIASVVAMNLSGWWGSGIG